MNIKTITTVALTLFCVGCGMNQEKFIEKAVEADCTYRLACYDEAVLTFEGWDSVASCSNSVRAQWEDAGSGAGCEYDKKTAKACIQSLEAQSESCPTEEGIPDVCLNVFTLCTDGGDDTDAADTNDTDSSGE